MAGLVARRTPLSAKETSELMEILFQVAIVAAERMHGRSAQEVAEWAASQLEACGFKTQPCGMSWGILMEEI